MPRSRQPNDINETNMLELTPKIDAAAEFIQSQWQPRPVVGIILGSGLGNYATQVQAEASIDYGDIPNFPQSTVMGHKGRLVCGQCCGVPVVVMAGRFHRYEGYSYQDLTLPVRVMKQLGIETLIVSNASGGVNPQYNSGDVMVLDDHINLMFGSPLIGINDDNLGPRFPDMCAPYDPQLSARALEIARQNNFVAHLGVYAALTGPTYETRAEYRMLRTLGADVIGMSTVPEVLVAVHSGLRILALSVVTNVCKPDSLGKTEGQEVVDVASAAEPKLTTIVNGILTDLAGGKLS
jgi:purine-nucleoside phosphorylase